MNTPSPSRQEISELQVRVETEKKPLFIAPNDQGGKLWKSTQQVYALRQFRPAFFSNTSVLPNADAALQTLANASSEGLSPEDFDVSELQNQRGLIENADSNTRNEFELHLTYSLARYVSQLCFGSVTPKQVNPEWPDTRKICDVPRLVNEALEQDSVAQLADKLSPQVTEFQGLKTALQRYRDIASGGGWQPVTVDSPKKKRGANTPQPSGNAPSSLLATNLVRLGDLTETNTQVPVSDAALQEALGKFQARHGLETTGKLDAKTAAAMNVPVEDRIAQIEINMDRMRWIADRFEPQHVRVNIPAFHLSVHESDQIPLEMKVIVGSAENRTPVLDSQIEYLVFSPYWNIPLSIATKELLPKIRKDPNFLQKEQMEVVRVSGNSVKTVDPSNINWSAISDGSQYQLRQRPGASNALGLVKFIFPNRYSVYLHDTPGDNLFDRLTRTLSHGCVRIEKPTEFAAYLLKGQPDWTAERIEQAMHAAREKHVKLKIPVPVHLLYWTAWADADGTVHFRDDVYRYDQVQRGLSAPIRAGLPAPNAPDVNVNEVGTGIVTNAAGLH